MTDSAKDALAAIVEERWVDLQVALSDSQRKYPLEEFRSPLTQFALHRGKKE